MISVELVHSVPLAELTQERVDALLQAAAATIDIPDGFQFTVAIVDNDEIHALNKEFRSQDKPTDVLSFPYDDQTGDIVISAQKVYEQAEEYGVRPEDEAAFLVVHGIVHIMGWDHERSEEEAKEQAAIETKIVEQCGLNYTR